MLGFLWPEEEVAAAVAVVLLLGCFELPAAAEEEVDVVVLGLVPFIIINIIQIINYNPQNNL